MILTILGALFAAFIWFVRFTYVRSANYNRRNPPTMHLLTEGKHTLKE